MGYSKGTKGSGRSGGMGEKGVGGRPKHKKPTMSTSQRHTGMGNMAGVQRSSTPGKRGKKGY